MSRVRRITIACLVLLTVALTIPRSGACLTVSASPVSELVFSEGYRHYTEGDVAAAEKLWIGIRSDSVYGPVTLILLARAYHAARDPRNAVRLLKDFVAKGEPGPYGEVARTIYVEALCAARDTEAIPLLQAMIRNGSAHERPKHIYSLAKLYRFSGDHAKAAEQYRTLFLEHPASVEGLRASDELAWMVVHGKIDKPVFSESEQLGRARRLSQEGRFDLAAESYTFLLKSRPADVDLMLKLASCQFRARKNKEAIRTLKEILGKNISLHDRMEALYLLSRVYWRLDRTREFERCCQEIIEKAPPKLKHKVAFNLGAYYYERGNFSAAFEHFKRLVNSPINDTMKSDVTWKIAWIHYRTGKYGEAAEAFRNTRVISPNGRVANPSRYWQARSLMHLGKTLEAKALFQQICWSAPLDYYGQEAARLLNTMGSPINSNGTRASFPDITLSETVLETEQVAAAKKLMNHGLHELALANLEHLPRSTSSAPSVVFLMARAAYGAQKYKRAREILATAFGQFMDNPPENAPPELVEIAFPRIHRDVTVRAAKDQGVDPHLVWAIVRQESLYDATAVSPAGALGLMQVTPKAAGLGDKKGRISPDELERILTPEQNLASGIRILSKNLRSFRNKVVPAIASYNADIQKVREWVSRNGSLSEDEFIENIPFFETRTYVKKVLAGYHAYAQLHRKFDLAGLW